MRFSIIMCTYNAAPFLPESVGSILGQTFDDFELIVVNDGSTDDSAEVLKSLSAEAAGRMHVISQKNTGQFLARRAAIDAAQGEYCVFCDADDALRQDALAVIDATICRSGADVVMYNFSTTRDFASPAWDLGSLCTISEENTVAGLQALRELLCRSTRWGSLWSKAFRRSCLVPGEQADLGRIEMAEDYIQTLRALGRAQTLVAVPEALYWYRENEQSATHRQRRIYLENSLLAREIAEEKAMEWNPELIPIVRGGKCEMIFDHCVRLLNGSHGKPVHDRVESVRQHAESDRFVRAYQSADLSELNAWKRLGVRLMGEGHLRLLVLYIDVLFGVTTRVIPDKVTRYTREIVD